MKEIYRQLFETCDPNQIYCYSQRINSVNDIKSKKKSDQMWVKTNSPKRTCCALVVLLKTLSVPFSVPISPEGVNLTGLYIMYNM